jgi:hypothetical protein
LAALTASTALALDASKNVVSVTNTGTGNNVLGTSPTMATPTITGDVQMSTGNLVVGTASKGIVDSTNTIELNFTSTNATLTAGNFIASAGAISGNNIYSYRGSTAYPTANVATTIFTMPSNGMYIVHFYLDFSNNTSYNSSTQAYKNGSSTRLANTQNGSLLTITLSGDNIQASHQVAGFAVTYSIQRLA